MERQRAGWNFDNRYEKLPDIFYTKVKPTPVREPKIVLFNEEVAKQLGLNDKFFQRNAGSDVLGGNQLPKSASSIAQAYAGHQFGHFTMLGDGRAILLGEQITPQNERYDIQLKGAGQTPYSRGGDGRGVLGPMLREYLISEAMYQLNVPTTRSLAVTETGLSVQRETEEKGAILTRIASSHIRVGTFQYAAAWGTEEELQILADYTIERHFPQIKNDVNPYLSLLEGVVKRQANLIAKWQLIGFVHGVMNTDNMTISGETIDYGPCAFIDQYDPNTVFSSIDHNGRYRYNNQPAIGAWNLTRFAETLISLIDENEQKAIEKAQDILMKYKTIYEEAWRSGMRLKLGLLTEMKGDDELINDLLKIMENEKLDYTNTFIYLTTGELHEFSENEQFQNWVARWKERVKSEGKSKEQVEAVMKKNNPAIIPRNYYVEKALKVANGGDYTVIKELLHALNNPFEYTDHQKKYRHVPDSFRYYQTFCGT